MTGDCFRMENLVKLRRGDFLDEEYLYTLSLPAKKPSKERTEALHIIRKTLGILLPDTRYIACVIVRQQDNGMLLAEVTHSKEIREETRGNVLAALKDKGYELPISWVVNQDRERHGCKVLRRMPKTGNLLSSLAPRRKGGINYVEDEWAKPREWCGPLSVFDKIKDAQTFARTMKSAKKRRTKYCIFACDYRPAPVEMLWCRISGENAWVHLDEDFPEGTRFALAVRITEEILT